MSDGKRILIIDDDPVITLMLKSNLEKSGYQVVTAADGLAGLAKYLSKNPDLIILDILMPKMDGYTFVQEFKKIGSVHTTPIIVLTSVEDMQDVFAIEGINDYVVKPFNTENFMKKIGKHLSVLRKLILIVDDAAEVTSLIEAILEDRGYIVRTAANGIDGLSIAKKETPDLVILDVMMPKLDGYRVCRMLKYDQRYKNIPVVMLSAKTEEEDKALAREVGVNFYLSKPFSGGALLHTMKEFLWD